MANTPDSACGKTSPERSVPTKARTSAASSKACVGSRTKVFLFLDVRNGQPLERYWQMVSQSHGECSMRNTGEFPREENASTLVCRSAPLSLRDTSPTGGDHADFDGECAGKVLFESEGLSGYSAEGFKAVAALFASQITLELPPLLKAALERQAQQDSVRNIQQKFVE